MLNVIFVVEYYLLFFNLTLKLLVAALSPWWGWSLVMRDRHRFYLEIKCYMRKGLFTHVSGSNILKYFTAIF